VRTGRLVGIGRGTVVGLVGMLGVLGAALAAGAAGQRDQSYRDNLPADHPAITYATGPFDDPVARLARAIEAGTVTLVYDDRFGYLPSLLDRLEVRIDSQALVFSKTSLQAPLISPRTPRSIYFSDTVAIGFVRGADVIELAAFDPKRGAVFYTVETTRSNRPRFNRPSRCLQCHQGAATLGVPGPYVGSVSTSASGRPAFRLGTAVTDHRTPFEERWGGWYVTGTHGAQQHLGNALARDPTSPAGSVPTASQNLTTLTRLVDTSHYLAPTSDLIALMTLEHQTQMINLFTRVGWEARIAEHDGVVDDAEADERARGVEEIVRYMLFADEAPLKDPIEGVSSFSESFPARGPRDRRGRSLRDFDLRTRLFRYPLSYMVYSDAFGGLPDAVRVSVYDRLFEVLTGDAETDRFARLSPADRAAILDIVRETRPGLPEYWKTRR